MKTNFDNIISKKTDEELITILSARREEYVEDLIFSAQREFDKRNISIDQIEVVKKEQNVIKEKEIELMSL